MKHKDAVIQANCPRFTLLPVVIKGVSCVLLTSVLQVQLCCGLQWHRGEQG